MSRHVVATDTTAKHDHPIVSKDLFATIGF